MDPSTSTYQPHCIARSRFEALRGLRCHLHEWGHAEPTSPERPPLVLLHGWMDVGASFQFVVDALAALEGAPRRVLAPDWRGFGLSEAPPADSYWFADYYGDLDALLDRACPEGPVDLAGHSMGGNVAMIYAGLRPARIRRLVCLEGFGMAATQPAQAPRRMAQWLDELKTPMVLRPYASLDDVAARLRANDPLLSADKARWLAPHWARRNDDGSWSLRADPAHKRVNPYLYRADETLQVWRQIRAPLLFVEGAHTAERWTERYPRAEFESRLAVVGEVHLRVLAGAGHMLHHDQPEALARELAAFLAPP